MKWEPIKLLRDLPNSDKGVLDQFINKFGFNRCAWYERPYQLTKLLAGDRSYNSGLKFDTPAYQGQWLDHGELYKVQGTTRIVAVGHDYGPYPHIREHVIDVVTPLKLRAVIMERASSWYYPNNTALVMVMTSETFQHYQKLIENDFNVIYII